MSPVCDDVVKFGAGMKEEVISPLLEGDVQGVVFRVDTGKKKEREKLFEVVFFILAITSRAVLPYLVKFPHFGEILVQSREIFWPLGKFPIWGNFRLANFFDFLCTKQKNN